MNIANVAAPLPAPGKVDGSTGPDIDRAGAHIEPDGPPNQGFGHILAQRMNQGGTDDAPPAGDPPRKTDDGTGPTGPDGTPAAALNAQPAPPAVETPSAEAGKDEATDTAGKVSGDAAGNDLAAQLALVSQWAALGNAPAARPAAGSQAGTDIKGKLDAIRSTPSKGDTAKAALQSAALPSAALQSAALQSAAITEPQTEPLLGKADAAGPHGATDTTSLAATFVNQVTSQIANTQNQTAVATPTAALHQQVGTPAWSNEVGQATLRLAANDLQTASLRLNPEHLGPLEVQVRLDHGVAHLSFDAAHAETRQAIESSRQTLDRLFADQGLKIGDCAVGDSGSSRRGFDADAAQADASRRDGNRWNHGGATGDDGAVESTVTTRLVRALGLVDTFA